MRKQSTTWLASIVLSFLLLPLAAYAQSDDPTSTAQSQATSLSSQIGTPEGVNARFSAPLTSSGTPMRTFDGTTAFDASMTCPSSSYFLEVFVQPGATGDLQTVIIKQDTNFDGTVDYTFTLPRRVSGVCGNGFISCNAGTWNACTFWKWKADSNGVLSIEQTGLTGLGGCYCINSSCGSSLVWNNISVILRDLGGGMAGAIQEVKPNAAIAEAKIEGTTITFYGQASGCTGSLSSPRYPSQYYDSPALISSDTTTVLTSQAGDPNSYYSMALTLRDSAGTSFDTHTCEIKREVTVRVRQKSMGQSPEYVRSFCCDHFSQLQLYKVNEGTYRLDFLDYGDNWVPHKNCWDGSGWHTGVKTVTIDEPLSFRVNSVTFIVNEWGGGCSTTNNTLSYTYASGISSGPVQVVGGSTCGAKSVQYLNLAVGYELQYDTDEVQEAVSNGCEAYENDTTCKLVEEKVDGVTTVRDYVPTSLSPLTSCRTYQGVGTYEYCRSFWLKQRTYKCERRDTLSFSDATSRSQVVTSTASLSGNSFTYSDVLKDESGNVSSLSYTADLAPISPSTSSCTTACIVKVPKQASDVSLVGPLTVVRTEGDSWNEEYRPCTQGFCPVNAGEIVKVDCSCIDQFAEVTGTLSAINSASKDMICSDGVPK